MSDDWTDAYVLRTIDYQDHGKLLYLYTEEGTRSALARGVKKMQSPLRALAQSGALIRVKLSKGTLPTLKEAERIARYPALGDDLVKASVAAVVRELIYYNVSADDDHPKLFGFMTKFLSALNRTTEPRQLLLMFELKLLYFLGYGVRFDRCGQCGSTQDLLLDAHTGMVLCQTHSDASHTLNEAAFAPLRTLLHADIETFTPIALDLTERQRLEALVESWYEHHLSSKPKALGILKTLD